MHKKITIILVALIAVISVYTMTTSRPDFTGEIIEVDVGYILLSKGQSTNSEEDNTKILITSQTQIKEDKTLSVGNEVKVWVHSGTKEAKVIKWSN
ncbi:hypothetical protein [Bacillus sp. 2205SS5-2]|uniref:hypothetical protein n=1 Tax=Bacillus sp. 2205SS5-2 TaxID=3109031 RepID=UPI0030049EB4